jgi:hypothetical protein
MWKRDNEDKKNNLGWDIEEVKEMEGAGKKEWEQEKEMEIGRMKVRKQKPNWLLFEGWHLDGWRLDGSIDKRRERWMMDGWFDGGKEKWMDG